MKKLFVAVLLFLPLSSFALSIHDYYPSEMGHGVNAVNPADSTTYYWGGKQFNRAITTSWGNGTTTIPFTGTITKAFLDQDVGTPGSSENSTLSIRLNDTTDYTFSSTVKYNVSRAKYSNNSLNIPVTAGDIIEVKWVTPAWATNPTGITEVMTLYIETTAQVVNEEDNIHFATTSADYWETLQPARGGSGAFSTTSTDYWFSTKTTTNLSEGSNLYYTGGRVDSVLNGYAKGFFFSTTSTDYWFTLQSGGAGGTTTITNISLPNAIVSSASGTLGITNTQQNVWNGIILMLGTGIFIIWYMKKL